jgi:hypothetical protein
MLEISTQSPEFVKVPSGPHALLYRLTAIRIERVIDDPLCGIDRVIVAKA